MINGRDGMAKWGKISCGGMRTLAEKMEKLGPEMEQVFRDVSQKQAGALMEKARKRTPVGAPPRGLSEDARKYWSGYTGGNLRKSWTAEPVQKTGRGYAVTVINNAAYASDVEYGHRQEAGRFVPALGRRLKVSFVPGEYMLHLSVKEVERSAPKALEQAVNEKLMEVFGGD